MFCISKFLYRRFECQSSFDERFTHGAKEKPGLESFRLDCSSTNSDNHSNELKQEQESQEEAAVCLACMARPPDAILVECGHGGLCAPCAGRLWRNRPARRRCPLCRQRFDGVLRITGRPAPDGSVRARTPRPRCCRAARMPDGVSRDD